MAVIATYSRPGRTAQRSRRGGQVLILSILAIALLVSLIFYVYNVGDQVNRRVEMQNVADASAVSGAGWMARSMNLVAMNNVAQARLLAEVPILDAIPLSTEMSHYEVQVWAEGQAAQLDRLRNRGDIDAEVRESMVEGIGSLLGRLQAQRDLLEPILATSDEIESATLWSRRGVGGAPPHGGLWRAAVTLDEFSQATVESAGLLAQEDAVRFAAANGGGAAFLVPVVPRLPVVRGELLDFRTVLDRRLRVDLENPITEGLPVAVEEGFGGAIPDALWPHRLGPWARLFARASWYEWYFNRFHGQRRDLRGWRHAWGTRIPVGPEQEREIPPREGRSISGPAAGGGRAGSGAYRGHGARQGGTYTWQRTELDEHGYRTYGPFYWSKELITQYARGRLGDTRFLEYFDEIAKVKLEYLFRGVNPELVMLHSPLWIMDFEEARRLGNDPTIRKSFTRYHWIEEISKEPEGHANWRSSITSTNVQDPVTRDFAGWLDPISEPGEPNRLREALFGGNPQVVGPVRIGAEPIWKFTWQGMERIYHPDGTLKDQWPVYGRVLVWFGGLDVGGDVEVSNPANWDEYDVPPAPMKFEPELHEYQPNADEGTRRDYFSYLAVIRRDTSAAAWPQRFTVANPTDSIFTMAQAKVFNNTSWDLWTQDWQVQLTRIRHWGDWAHRVEMGIGAAAQTGDVVSDDELERAAEYMQAFTDEMMELYVQH